MQATAPRARHILCIERSKAVASCSSHPEKASRPMISMYSASVPVFLQMLGSLDNLLVKAQAHAADKGIDAEVLLQSRLAPDMFPLVRQVQVACDFARSVTARLAD